MNKNVVSEVFAKLVARAAFLRIIIPVGMTFILFVLSVFLLFIPSLEKHMMDQKKEMIRELTESSCSLLSVYNQRVRLGELTLEDAHSRVVKRIRGMRYGPEGKDYFWINDMHPRMVMHPYLPELDGHDLKEFNDPNGKHLFVEFVNTVRTQGSGYVDYMWQWKDNPERIVPKVSYVKLFEPWGWIIGTGIYVEDVRSDIASITQRLFKIFAGILAIVLVLSFYIIWQNIKVEKKRERADEALRESEIRFRTLVEQLPAITYTAALDESSATLYVSPQIEKILDITPEEYKADPDFWLKHIHDEDRERVLKEVSHAHETGQPFISEYRMTSTDGRVVWLRDEAVIVKDDRGNPLYLQGVMFDITRQKQIEEELAKHREHLEEMVQKRTDEFEAINRELEAFSYSVSHDLRAPLRTIDGFSHALLEEYSGALDEQGQHYLQRVRAGAQNMGNLIDDILNLSRVGRRPMNKKTINLETIAGDAYKSLEDERRDRNVSFNAYECPKAYADAHLMQIVFANLLSNALKFTRNRAKAEIEVGCETKDKQTVFFVKDNGVGFDMKYIDKLFTPFQRLHRAEEYEGTGIGLATVQRIIQRHGGRIWVESEMDVGTTFYFSLPRS